MRILWVTQNGGNYKNPTVKGTGGWIGAMQEAFIERNPFVELGVVFFHPTDSEKKVLGNVTYMPVEYDYGKTSFRKLFYRNFRDEEKYLNQSAVVMAKKVSEFHPDIVHIWGIEDKHSQIIEYLPKELPFVVHIQGFSSTCLYSFFPPGFSKDALRLSESIFDRMVLKRGEYFFYSNFVKRAERERSLFPKVLHWIGRTNWDRSITQLLSPHSNYYHCEELIRPVFSGVKWRYHYDGKTINLQSTISCDWYKGLDVVLKTASVLNNMGVKVCWKVYGWDKENKKIRYFIKKLSINPEEVGVHLMGCVEGNEILKGLLSCDCYVHPSYIENSSNAIAEAQYLGVPVIAQYVGGNPSMLRDNTGILVAPNEPFILASKILEIIKKEVAEFYSFNALSLAEKRQDKDSVCCELIKIYNEIIGKAGKV